MQATLDTVIFNKVSKVVRFVVGSEAVERIELSPSTTLSGDLALGRLGRMKLAVGLEEAFDVEFENDKVLGFTVVGDIVGHLSTRYFQDVEPAWAN